MPSSFKIYIYIYIYFPEQEYDRYMYIYIYKFVYLYMYYMHIMSIYSIELTFQSLKVKRSVMQVCKGFSVISVLRTSTRIVSISSDIIQNGLHFFGKIFFFFFIY